MTHLIFEPRIWILIAGGLAWLFKAAQKTPPSGSARPPAGPDAAADERTRRVQEEVRRKIADRQAGRRAPVAAPASYRGPIASPVEAPRPTAVRPSWIDRHADPAPIQIEEPSPAADAEDAAALARQQKLADQLNALNVAARAAQTRQSAAITASVLPSASAAAEGWLAELRQPQGVRRAILLREILGPPIGLR
jgi:hypothetical protein